MWPRADPRSQCESGVRGQSFLERLWRFEARRRDKLESEQMSRECTVNLKSRCKYVSDDDKREARSRRPAETMSEARREKYCLKLGRPTREGKQRLPRKGAGAVGMEG